jgi:predicted AlkP superfamily pyrophosphatase or phosphodiesterase
MFPAGGRHGSWAMLRAIGPVAALVAVLVAPIARFPADPSAAAGELPPDASARARGRVVLISLDGLYPDIYRRPRDLGLRVPNLEKLARDGTSADGMLGIFPTATYPSHTTLVTGVRPARHRVVANSVFAPGTADAPWYWFADSLAAVTMPQAAQAAGLVTAVSNWPALVGAPYVTWHLPEIWSLGGDDATSREKTLQWATPGLVAEVERRFGAWTDDRFEWGRQDDRITDGAVYLIEAKRPDLLLVHLVEVDHVLHAAGRDAPAALRAFEAADRQIGRILAALERAGLRAATNVVVVGDHGFTNLHTEVRPNVELVALGLLEPGGGSRNTWRALARTSTAAAAVYLRDPSDAEARRRAYDRFVALASERYSGVFQVLDRAALDAYGAFPDAIFGLACLPGYAFSGRDAGEFLVPARSRGMHGYRPEEPSMRAGFVACGPDFAPGRRVPEVRMLDVAPTLATVLGVDLGPGVEGIAVPGLLREREASR